MPAASSPTSPRGAPQMFRRQCLPPVTSEATAAAIAAAGARTRVKQFSNKKAAQSRGFSHSVRSRGSVRHRHGRSNRYALIEIGDVVVEHTDAAVGYEAPDRV